jgi:hypothetical protein
MNVMNYCAFWNSSASNTAHSQRSQDEKCAPAVARCVWHGHGALPFALGEVTLCRND